MIRRRAFLTSTIPGVLILFGSGGKTARALASYVGAASAGPREAMAIRTVESLKAAETRGNVGSMKAMYHPEAMLFEPNTLHVTVGNTAVVGTQRKTAEKRKQLYFYTRQPKVLVSGKSALMVANFEQGEEVGGKIIETNGKALFILSQGQEPTLVSAQIVVPNFNSGSYGPLGTSQSGNQFGVYPSRAIGIPVNKKTQEPTEPLHRTLIANMEQINADWAEGNIDKLLTNYNQQGAFSLGDFGPFYLNGLEEVRQHFVDFYSTSKVNYIKSYNPVVVVYSDIAAVAFQFDSELVVSGNKIRAFGKGVYVFTNTTSNPNSTESAAWRMAGCVETSFVSREIGDPYAA
jgi:hypothetical protein